MWLLDCGGGCLLSLLRQLVDYYYLFVPLHCRKTGGKPRSRPLLVVIPPPVGPPHSPLTWKKARFLEVCTKEYHP
jgi:hypothetical protein